MAFTETLGAIFEHSPWVAQRAAESRPFASRLDLLDAMRTVVRDAPIEDQLNLIRAHPQLGARGRKRLELTEASSREQRRAGLDACSDTEFAELMQLNTAYVHKFDFPFILAVRGHDPESIRAFMRTRLNNNMEQERHTALTQIGLIGGYRLADLVSNSAAAEVRAMYERLGAAARTDVPAATSATANATASTDASAAALSAAPLLREWMLAAGLDVRAGIGFTPASTGYFLFGAYFDSTAATPRRDGSLSSLLGIAIAQSLRAQQRPTRFGLLVSPFPLDGQEGSILLDAPPGSLRDHITLAAADIDPLIPLRAAGIAERCTVAALSVPSAPSAIVDPNALDRTVSALESFLTQSF
jgi:2-oxo-4-hydroxy-4-carboxy-5-ureidoimidazoline decarboxylase